MHILLFMDYHSIFSWVLVGFIVITCVLFLGAKNKFQEIVISKIMIILFGVFNVLFWGTRPFTVGADTGNYVRKYHFAEKYLSLSDYLHYLDGDYFFGILVYYLSRIGDVNVYLIGISLFTMLGFLAFFMKLTKYYSHAILGLLMIASMFSFAGMLSNIIRNGLAIALFLPCTFYFFSKNYKIATLWGIASLLSHQSILLPILGLSLVHLIRIPLRYYFIVYGACSVMALANIGVHSFSFIQNLGILKLNEYVNLDLDFYRTGFRPDFFALNTFFLLIFWILGKSGGRAFDRYLKLYIVMSSIFFLCFHIPFSDRFGIYSWVLIPVVLFLGTQNYNIKYRLTLTSVSTLALFFINQLIYVYTHVPEN